MAKKSKLSTPDWIKEGYDFPAEDNKARQKAEPLTDSSKRGQAEEKKEESPSKRGQAEEKKEGKTFRIRECPKCGSDDVGVKLVGEEGKSANNWECRKCKWVGRDVEEKELTEEEFMKYLDEKGEGVT
ncbi:MAG: hypothetical protein KKB31_01795 [Nanoarchaeota archaeon]|nr:hypothetical protein [Nanoarchaeota archaeon]